MNFTQLVEKAKLLSGRPELEDLTKLAVQTATQEAHGFDFWRRDHYDQYVVFAAAAQEQTFSLAQLPRFRALSYVRKWDVTGINPTTSQPTGWVGPDFGEVPADKVFDSYGVFQDNKFYISNNYINLRSWTAFKTLLVGYYRMPNVNEDAYESWIAEQYPAVIYLSAAAKVAGDTGDNEIEARLTRQYSIHLEIMKNSSIEAVAR